MKRIGRPPLSKQDRKSKLIMVRVTSKEYSQLQRAAKRNGLSTSEFVRKQALKGATKA
jgi:uncharacterized protein (DUF1778 family)